MGSQPAAEQGLEVLERREMATVVNEIMLPREVAALFGVIPKTIANRADAGLIEAFRTCGGYGHRRYRAEQFKKWFPDLIITQGK
jgi:hypothetical protein